MPIYAYRCSSCGHAKDVLQKMSDPLLTDCPACGTASFVKQLTAAGFQLKGSGWYVTDFRDGGAAVGADKGDKGGEAAKPGGGDGVKTDAPKNDVASSPAAAPAAAAKPDAPASAKPAVANAAAKSAAAPASGSSS